MYRLVMLLVLGCGLVTTNVSASKAIQTTRDIRKLWGQKVRLQTVLKQQNLSPDLQLERISKSSDDVLTVEMRIKGGPVFPVNYYLSSHTKGTKDEIQSAVHEILQTLTDFGMTEIPSSTNPKVHAAAQ